MAKITTAAQLAERALDVAKNYKTIYVMGCFGAPMTDKNKTRYCKNHSFNQDADRQAMIKAATSDTFGFDCVCLIKALLWEWSGNTSMNYGGAIYGSNGVPDIGADAMISQCKDVSTDFSKIEVGEAVWMKGHIGIYIGNGLAVECTPAWKNCVQVTACNCSKSGYQRRNWTKHGKLPYVTYTAQPSAQKATGTGVGVATAKKPDVIYQVYAGGKWWSEVTNFNTKDANGYAGVMGKEISGIRVKLSNGKTVTVSSHISGKSRTDWLDPVTKWDDSSDGYSGWKGKPTDCIAMKAEGCTLKYRVHVKDGGWLGWISKCDVTDYNAGLAGAYGKPIDAVQIAVV